MATRSKPFKPQNLRALLGFMLFLIIAGGGAIYYFGLDMVRSYAIEIRDKDQEATLLEQQAAAPAVTQENPDESAAVAASQVAASAAQSLTVPTSEAEAKLRADVTAYAAQASLSIANATFVNTAEQPYALTITLTEPATYRNVLTFITLVENSKPLLQISNLSFERDATDDAVVETGPITIQIATRDA